MPTPSFSILYVLIAFNITYIPSIFINSYNGYELGINVPGIMLAPNPAENGQRSLYWARQTADVANQYNAN